MAPALTLYTYFRSSAAWRVRIALALKGLDYESIPVHLLKDGGQQHSDSYRGINPQALVPTLMIGDQPLSQSLAICEYLDECYPEPSLLGRDPMQRATVRMLALAIATDIHPINNLRVLQYLKGPMGMDQAAADQWYLHWVKVGFDALESHLTRLGSEHFCVGESVSLADVCLVPQVFNARRFKIDLAQYPRIAAIDAHLMTLPAFAETAPAKQADAE
jgi:maleylacetoacetate isomerase